MDGDFLECLGLEFGALGAVAVGTEAKVGTDDFLFSVGQGVEGSEYSLALFFFKENMVGVCGVITGYILSAFFCFFVGIAAVEVDELKIK